MGIYTIVGPRTAGTGDDPPQINQSVTLPAPISWVLHLIGSLERIIHYSMHSSEKMLAFGETTV